MPAWRRPLSVGMNSSVVIVSRPADRIPDRDAHGIGHHQQKDHADEHECRQKLGVEASGATNKHDWADQRNYLSTLNTNQNRGVVPVVPTCTSNFFNDSTKAQMRLSLAALLKQCCTHALPGPPHNTEQIIGQSAS